MLFIHRPREPFDMGAVMFRQWQGSIEALVSHIVREHLEFHDDQKPGCDKSLIYFNGDGVHNTPLRMCYDRLVFCYRNSS